MVRPDTSKGTRGGGGVFLMVRPDTSKGTRGRGIFLMVRPDTSKATRGDLSHGKARHL